MARPSDLPERVVADILDAIRVVVPIEVHVSLESPGLARYDTKVTLHNRRGRYSRVISQYASLAPRNRDGIRPESIAWVVWNNLDTLVQLSRRCGSPWPQDEGTDMQAYAQHVDGEIHGWVLNTTTMARIELPPIGIGDVTAEPPRGIRLPFPLPRRYELPTDGGPVTSPGNRG